MGYSTDFEGYFKLDKPLTDSHKLYLEKFSSTRRMKRDSKIAATFKDKVRESVGLPIGKDGCYYVDAGGFAGQDRDSSIVDYNEPPDGQPGLWCQWVPTQDGTGIEWDGGEKFYEYTKWLQYLIKNFLSPWGYTINGKVSWKGENINDKGSIVVEDNSITVTRRL